MDLIIGGGTYGEQAFQKLRQENTPVVVLDTDANCALRTHQQIPSITVGELAAPGLPPAGYAFIEGGIAEAADIITRCRPERIFPTAPVHVSACIISEIAGFKPDPKGSDDVAVRIPKRFFVGRNSADIYCSFNPDTLCLPDCPEPAVCPVTGERRDVPLWSMLRQCLSKPVPDDINDNANTNSNTKADADDAAVSKGAGTHQTGSTDRGTKSVVIQSRQCGPGLGYILTSDLFFAIDSVREEQRVWIGTACKCHGVVTALGKNQN